MAVMFVDGPEFCLVPAQLDAEGNILTKFQDNPTSGLAGDAITKMFTVGRNRRTPESSQAVRKVPLDYVQKS